MSIVPRILAVIAFAGTSCVGNASSVEACPIQDIAELCLVQNSLSEMEAWVINRGWTWVANPKIESKGGAAIITDTEGAQYRLSYRKYSDMISVQCSHGTLDQFVADGNLQIPDCSNVVEAVEKIVPTGTLITTVSSEKMIGKNFHFEQGSKRFDADVVVQREWFEGIPLPAIIHTNMIHLLDAH